MPDAAAQHEVLVEVGAGQRGRVGVVARLEVLGSARAGSRGRPGRRAPSASTAARSPYDAPRSLTASSERSGSMPGGAASQSREDCRRPRASRRTPSCRAARSARRASAAHPAVGLHPGQHPVDLLVAWRCQKKPIERSKRRARSSPDAGSLAQRDEQRVLQGHGDGLYATSCMQGAQSRCTSAPWPPSPAWRAGPYDRGHALVPAVATSAGSDRLAAGAPSGSGLCTRRGGSATPRPTDTSSAAPSERRAARTPRPTTRAALRRGQARRWTAC